MHIRLLTAVSEFLPRRIKRAALLKAMLLHNGVDSPSETAKAFNAVGLHPSTTSDWLANEALESIPDLPDTETKNAVSKWIDSIPESLKYETTNMLKRDVNINCRLINKATVH